MALAWLAREPSALAFVPMAHPSPCSTGPSEERQYVLSGTHSSTGPVLHSRDSPSRSVEHQAASMLAGSATRPAGTFPRRAVRHHSHLTLGTAGILAHTSVSSVRDDNVVCIGEGAGTQQGEPCAAAEHHVAVSDSLDRMGVVLHQLPTRSACVRCCCYAVVL